MAQRYRPRPMPLSDEEFERLMRAEEALANAGGGFLGDGNSAGDDWRLPVYTSNGPRGESVSVGQAPHSSDGDILESILSRIGKKEKPDSPDTREGEPKAPEQQPAPGGADGKNEPPAGKGPDEGLPGVG
ncbi:MAG: hypothetical protein LIP28_06880, partial [Deltaproteobacteria bacterium]|nr:hypothetical protein [Deltaproteobacteria bacterium]